MKDKIVLNKENIIPLLEEMKNKLENQRKEREENPMVFYRGKYQRLNDVRMSLDD